MNLKEFDNITDAVGRLSLSRRHGPYQKMPQSLDGMDLPLDYPQVKVRIDTYFQLLTSFLFFTRIQYMVSIHGNMHSLYSTTHYPIVKLIEFDRLLEESSQAWIKVCVTLSVFLELRSFMKCRHRFR